MVLCISDLRYTALIIYATDYGFKMLNTNIPESLRNKHFTFHTGTPKTKTKTQQQQQKPQNTAVLHRIRFSKSLDNERIFPFVFVSDLHGTTATVNLP